MKLKIKITSEVGEIIETLKKDWNSSFAWQNGTPTNQVILSWVFWVTKA